MADEAVKLAVCPTQMAVGPLMVKLGLYTATVVIVVPKHPLVLPMTEYVVVVSGKSVITGVVAPVFQE